MGTATAKYIYTPFWSANAASTNERINSNDRGFATRFIAKSSATISNVSCVINSRSGSNLTTGRFQIRKDNGGNPASTYVLRTGTFGTQTLTTGKWFTVNLATAGALTVGSTYWFVYDAESGYTTSNYWVPRYITTNQSEFGLLPFGTYGQFLTKKTTDNGSNWTTFTNSLCPFILSDASNNFIDGFAHETGAASNATFGQIRNNKGVAEKIHFSESFTASSIATRLTWAPLTGTPKSNLYCKIFNQKGVKVADWQFVSTTELIAGAPGGSPADFASSITIDGVTTAYTFTSAAGFYTIMFYATSAAVGYYGLYSSQSFASTVIAASWAKAKGAKFNTSNAYQYYSATNASSGGTSYNNASDGIYDLHIHIGYSYISGKVKTNSNTNFQGCKVNIKLDGNIYSSTYTNSSGEYEFKTYPGGNLRIEPSYNDWEFSPDAHTVNNVPLTVPTSTFTQTDDSKWWTESTDNGQGRSFAFRRKILFSTPHGILYDGYVANMDFQTGYGKIVASNAHYELATPYIDNAGTLTFIVWRDGFGNIRLAMYEQDNNIWSYYTVAYSGDYDDSHFYGSIKYNPSNSYIYIFIGGHETSPLSYIRGRVQDIGGGPGGGD